jgi:hypothetical protein
MSNASFVLKKFLDDNIIKIMKGKNMVFLLQFFTMILISMVIEIIVVNNLPKWQKKEHEITTKQSQPGTATWSIKTPACLT